MSDVAHDNYWRGVREGALEERERIIKIIERINNHGMTHSEKCLRHHLFAEQALKEINK